jgi:hypothetical protein
MGGGEHLDDRGTFAVPPHRQKHPLIAPFHDADYPSPCGPSQDPGARRVNPAEPQNRMHESHMEIISLSYRDFRAETGA